MALDDVVTVLVAVVSSLGAVAVSAYLGEYFSDRRERKKATGLVLSCVDSVRLQSPGIKSIFETLPRTDWTRDNLPILSRFLREFRPIDTSLFSKARDNLLNLDSELIDSFSKLELLVAMINHDVYMLTEFFTSPTEVATFIDLKRKYFVRMTEFSELLSSTALSLRNQIVQRNREPKIDWDSLLKKITEANEELIKSPAPQKGGNEI